MDAVSIEYVVGGVSVEAGTGGYAATPVEHSVSPVALTSEDMGKRHIIAVGPATVTLPPATGSGKRVFLWKTDAGALTVTADGTETIKLVSLSATSWQNGTGQVDAFIEIEDRSAGVWGIPGYAGTWETV